MAAAKYGFLFQGQYYRWQKKRRGTPSLDLVTLVLNYHDITYQAVTVSPAEI